MTPHDFIVRCNNQNTKVNELNIQLRTREKEVSYLRSTLNLINESGKLSRNIHVYVRTQASTVGLTEHAPTRVKIAKYNSGKMGTMKKPFLAPK